MPRKVVVDTDKYGILRELIGQYEQLERRIYDDDKFSDSKTSGGHKRPEQSIGIQLSDLLTRNSELDGIRANIVELCRTSDSSKDNTDSSKDTSFDGGDASMQALRQLTNNYLNQDILRQSGEESVPDPASQEEAKKQSFKELSAYIDRALALYNVLAGYTNGTGTDAEGSQDMNISKVSVELLGEDESKSSSEAPPADNDSAGLIVRTFRNYAQGLTYSNFQISYDAFMGGRLGLNPVKDDIDALYSSTIVAWFILFICFIVDMMAFFAGLILFKDVYLFRKNNMIEEIGYLNYETALSSLFTIPKESRERVLCLAAVYKLLYGDASEDGETLDTDTNSAEDSGTPDEDINTARDGETPEESTNTAGDGGTPEESTNTAGDGETPDEDTGTAGDSGTLDEDIGTAEDGGTPDEDSRAAGNNGEVPRGNGSAVEEVGETPGEAEREPPSQALAEVSRETDSQVVLAKRMREILGSEDFKKFYRKVELVLRVLGISEDEETSYGMFLLWLRSYAERNNLDFDDVFLSDDK